MCFKFCCGCCLPKNGHYFELYLLAGHPFSSLVAARMTDWEIDGKGVILLSDALFLMIEDVP
jgi:hypothetical protein